MSMKSMPLEHEFYVAKTGGYRGIPSLLIFSAKHRLWVLVRTASMRSRRFLRVPTINVLSRTMERYK